jgi:phosphosulfolactate phosphohydrolase-like enzyme
VLGALALDDAYCAGRIAHALGGEPTDSAQAAIRLAQSFPSALEGLGASRSAANLRKHGMEADVDVCARESVLDVVPRLVGLHDGAAEISL